MPAGWLSSRAPPTEPLRRTAPQGIQSLGRVAQRVEQWSRARQTNPGHAGHIWELRAQIHPWDIPHPQCQQPGQRPSVRGAGAQP